MDKKTLILHIPVIHRGYLDFLRSRSKGIEHVYLIDQELLEGLTKYKPDIASLDVDTVKELLEKFGFRSISILSKTNINELKGKGILLIQDEVSRNLYEQYLKDQKVEWASVFLRWDSDSVVTETPPENISVSKEPFDIEMMREAHKEAEKSGDWWRQVGGVAVKDGKIVLRAYNQGVPADHTPYQVGMVRDFFKAGERQELSNTIHAEQKLIAEAAKRGISFEGTSLYLTHFPCAVCAKMIAYSGISVLYFREGASTLDGKKILESAGITLFYIP
ncbi:MAG: hypothetical protein HYS52_00110 [Candidatus Wildermuthbacteria bacterium]|nr:hypothetical protein [Candidatus Wildermuthbacteria bacterium]